MIPLIVIEESSLGEPRDRIGIALNWASWLAFVAEAGAMLAVFDSLCDLRLTANRDPLSTLLRLAVHIATCAWTHRPPPCTERRPVSATRHTKTKHRSGGGNDFHRYSVDRASTPKVFSSSIMYERSRGYPVKGPANGSVEPGLLSQWLRGRFGRSVRKHSSGCAIEGTNQNGVRETQPGSPRRRGRLAPQNSSM